jgi:hypothetical protein
MMHVQTARPTFVEFAPSEGTRDQAFLLREP